MQAVLVALAVGAGTAGVVTLLGSSSKINEKPSRISLDVPATSTPFDPTRPTMSAPPSASASVTGISAPPPSSAVGSIVPSTSAGATPGQPDPGGPGPGQPTGGPGPTTTRPPVTTTAAPPPVDSTVAPKVLNIVNNWRLQFGCAPISLDSRLNRASQNHSADMAANNYYSHTSQDGRSYMDRAYEQGYWMPGGENLARGPRTAEEVMNAWMNSSSNRANILNCNLRTMGVGLAGPGYYWTQMFGY
ncbi:Uncharacterized conserved protein YkwD, contains CAP (CSP/antigen 5/PR1) domain [Actinokineospora alba]|uniref:Uncharacterized conserved protein YkwD, contains CAP (CSP/antigen 5/PR1) domain n=1 Tax=Actinokineospora alba TaxID=504798 RepID=A0A1H0I2Z4_9PSEU|nr:uncharacterized protein YkwD [Actinokineospora alba]SDI85620.1 Uncharacterized conserved protein YkwD, contains CAP (CSP/antigen 5/PR1) domain [Actinokineospora alba]SDO25816.1 Uncharacterized conserved protein YkwD, contains CAP (CSP/antigen 5/PR1) domain [Actinokineospora alba]